MITNRLGQPDFTELMDSTLFEDFCTDVLRRLPETDTAERYGKRGQAQYGIDIVVRLKSGEVHLAQCKLYRAFTAKQIATACTEFLSNQAAWEPYKPNRFILIVSADLGATAIQDEINEQAKFFGAAGVELSVWSGETLYAKALSLNDGLLLRTYFREPAWSSQNQEVLTAAVNLYPQLEEGFRQRLEDTSWLLTEQAKNDLERTRIALRAGKHETVQAAIADSERILQYVPPDVAAGWLRLNAVSLLRLGREDEARSFADRADKIDPSSEASLRLQAALTYEDAGPLASLEILSAVREPDTLLLKASFHLVLQQYSDARQILESICERNAEYYRLSAWLAFVDRRINDIESAIEEGLRIEPEAEGLKLVKAVALYYGTHVEAAWPAVLPDIPRPMDWAFIKTDAASQRKASEALAIFDHVLQRGSAHGPEKEVLELWRLACLAVDQSQQGNAEQYARELLAVRPASYFVLEWIIQRDWSNDISANIADLEQQVTQGNVDWFAVIVIANFWLSKGRPDVTIKTLNTYQDRFVTSPAKTTWASCMAAAALRNKDYATALAVLEQAPGDVTFIRLSVEAEKARETHRYEEVLETLNGLDLTNAFWLLTACEIWADAGRWTEVFDRREQLLSALANEYSYSLVITASYNCREFRECADLIKNMKEYAPVLPATIQRIDVLVGEKLGNLRQAYEQANALVKVDESNDVLLDLARLAFELGDRTQLGRSAKLLLGKDLTAEQQLRFAMWLQFDDLKLARNYWERARAHLRPELVTTAIDLASRLGIEEGVAELYSQLNELALAGKYGVSAIPLNELKDKVLQWRRGQAETANLYALGQIPVHLFARTHRIPLSRLYYNEFARSARKYSPIGSPPTYALYASREPISISPKHEVYLDTTAVLTAYYFGIFPAVEQTFERIFVPATIIPILQHMRSQSGIVQRGRVEVEEIIDKAEREGNLQATMPGDNPSATLVELEDGTSNLSWRSVLESLLTNNAISQEEFASVRTKLGSLWTQDPVRYLEAGAELHFGPAVLDSMPDPLIVQRTIAHFRVSTDMKWLQHIRSEIDDAMGRREAIEHLEGLIAYLEPRVGRRFETYQVTPNHDAEDEGMLVDVLSALLEIKDGTTRAVWIDDRFFNAFTATASGVPVISIIDVIRELGEAKTLNEDMRTLLKRLRLANVRWLEVDAAEIVVLLRQSPIVNARVEPTSGLVELRQYFAAAMYGAGFLRPPVQPGAQEPLNMGELPYLLRMRRAVLDSIIELWRMEGITATERAAFSSWIYRNLWAEVFSNNTIWPGKPTRPTARQSFTQFITALLVGAYPLLKPVGRRAEMMEWLDHEILEVRSMVDEDAVLDIARLLEKIVMGNFATPAVDLPDADRYTVAVLADFINDLPNRLKLSLDVNGELMRLVGGATSENIDIEGNWIDSLAYCQALGAALEKGSAEIILENAAHPIVFTSIESSVPTVRAQVGKKHTEVRDPALAILVAGNPLGVVRSMRSAIDTSNEGFELFIASLGGKSRAQVLNEFMHRRQKGATARYQEIYRRLAARQSLDNAFLFPLRGESIREHFRFDLWKADANYDAFARRVLEEEGREVGMARVMAFPLPLPPAIVTNWTERDEGDQMSYIRHLLRTAHSPTRAWHVARLLGLSKVRGGGRLARRIVRRLLAQESRPWFQAFGAMLKWTQRVARYDREIMSEGFSKRLLLEWGHTHEIFLAFTAAGVDLDWLKNQFGEAAGQSILADVEAVADVAAPEEFSTSRFMLFGAAYAMEGVDHPGSLRGALEAQLTRLIDNEAFPRFSVLRDTAIMANATGSLLQMNAKRQAVIGAILGNDTAESLNSAALHMRVVADITGVAGDDDTFVPWNLLGAVVGRSEIYEDCVEPLNGVLQASNFVEMFKANRQEGQTTLHVAILTSRNVRTEASHIRLLHQLFEIAAWCAEHLSIDTLDAGYDEADDSAGYAASWLFQMAVNLAFARTDQTMSISAVISELIRLWPATAKQYRSSLQRMFETEPLEKGELLSEAILFARAQAA
jgi:hypothetical protein